MKTEKPAEGKRILSIIMAVIFVIAMAVSSFPENIVAKAKKVSFNSYVRELGKISYDDHYGTFIYNHPEILKPEEQSRYRSGIPHYYNLAEKGLSTSVKDQGAYGTCWAHAALASMESNMLKKNMTTGDPNLSERHLAWYAYQCVEPGVKDPSMYAGNDRREYIGEPDIYNRGGLVDTSVFSMARGYGAVYEANCPYNKEKAMMGGADEADGARRTLRQVAMRSANYLPETAKFSFNGTTKKLDSYIPGTRRQIKEAIIASGAIYTAYHAYDRNTDTTGPFMNTAYAGYYCWDDSLFANHAVTIVGWDDGFAKEKFNDGSGNIPQGDGAWIVKNSWGKKEGKDGYIYISYFDKTIMDYTSYEAAYPVKEEKNIYQYDGLGTGDVLCGSDTPVESANVFTARSKERINAIGTYTPAADSKVEISIYPIGNNGKPGNKVFSQRFRPKYAGFHTLKLQRHLVLTKGQKCMISVKTSFTDNGKTVYFIPTEVKKKDLPLGWPITKLDVRKDQSFVKMKGINHGNWCDITSLGEPKENIVYGNALVKMYTGATQKNDKDYLSGETQVPTPQAQVTKINKNRISVTVFPVEKATGYEIAFGNGGKKKMAAFRGKCKRIAIEKRGIGNKKVRVRAVKENRKSKYTSLLKPAVNKKTFKVNKNYKKISKGRLAFSVESVELKGSTYVVTGYLLNHKSKNVNALQHISITVFNDKKAVIAKYRKNNYRANSRKNSRKKMQIKFYGKSNQDLRQNLKVYTKAI